MRNALVFVLGLCFSQPAWSSDHVSDAQPVAEIMAQQKALNEQVRTRAGQWANRPEKVREPLLARQERLFTLLEGRQRVSDLDPKSRLEVANLLEAIKADVTGRTGDRKVCTREQIVGSNFSRRVCRTESQMARHRDMARDELRKRPMAARSNAN